MLNKNTKDVILSVRALCPCVCSCLTFKNRSATKLQTCLIYVSLSKENSENFNPGASYISVFVNLKKIMFATCINICMYVHFVLYRVFLL